MLVKIWYTLILWSNKGLTPNCFQISTGLLECVPVSLWEIDVCLQTNKDTVFFTIVNVIIKSLLWKN